MTGQWAPLWTGALVGLGGLVLAGLFEHFHRVYGHRHLRIWALSWLVGGVHVLLDAVPYLAGTTLPGAGEGLRLLTGYAHCLLLVWGVFEGATGERAPARPVRIGVLSILGLSALAVVPTMSGLVTVAYGGITAGAYLLTGLWLLALTGPRCLGSAVVGVGVGVHGLLQIYELMLAGTWNLGLEIAALASVMVEFLVALGLVIWLLQEARDHAVRATADFHRLRRELLETSGRERQELGRELHDGLGQVLTGIGFRVAQLEGALRQGRDDVPVLAGEIKALVRSAVTQADNLARGLGPVSMHAEGMATALEALADSISRLKDVRCTVGGVEVDIADPSVANQLYMIAEEAALTAVRSYGHRRIELAVRASGDGGVLHVRCWEGPSESGVRRGPGSTTRERILHYRASVIDGALDIVDSDEGERTILCRFQQAPRAGGLSEAG